MTESTTAPKTDEGEFVPGSILVGVLMTLWFLIRDRCLVSPKARIYAPRHVRIGAGSHVSSFATLHPGGGAIDIGRHAQLGPGVVIAAQGGLVRIGDDTLVSPNVIISGDGTRSLKSCRSVPPFEIRIGSDVWLAAGAILAAGANVDDGAIVSPKSKVAGRVPKFAIVQGDPAKVFFSREAAARTRSNAQSD